MSFLPRSSSPRELLSTVLRLQGARRKRVARALVIDGDGELRDLLPATLGEHELDVSYFDDAHTLWNALASEGADMVLIDLESAGSDGLSLCRIVRADARLPGVAVVTFVRPNDLEAMNAAFDAGADDCISKPVVKAELLARLRTQIERGSLIHALREIDSLTGLKNRWHCERTIANLLRLGNRQDKPVSVAIVDIDRFKHLNARWGHRAGDDTLRRFGELCRESLRAEDEVGRWGGDEFVIAMYDAEPHQCMERLAELLETFRSERFATAQGQDFQASFSAGVAEFPGDGDDFEKLYDAANDALRRGKASRGRVLTTQRARVGTEPDANEYRDVVIVEDDVPLAELLLHALETRGYAVAHIADGETAAAQLGSGQLGTSLVLLDVGLPGLDGFGVLRTLRDRGILEKTKVVALTVRSSEEETLRALELGATDLIPKPFSIPVLMRRVHYLLEQHE